MWSGYFNTPVCCRIMQRMASGQGFSGCPLQDPGNRACQAMTTYHLTLLAGSGIVTDQWVPWGVPIIILIR